MSEFQDLDKLVKQGAETVKKEDLERINAGETTGEASKESAQKVLENIKKAAGADATSFDVFMVLTLLLQTGATSNKVPATKRMAFNTASITVNDIRTACGKERITVRQLARSLKDPIVDLLFSLGDNAPEGNLARTIRLELKNISRDEAIWASDFQTYNDRCPTRVRNWLVKNYRARFRGGQQQ
jgi:hypothetical protein